MKLKSFSIFDAKSNLFSQPFHTHNKATAQRSFAEDVNTEGTAPNKHPTDYSLFEIGEYDNEKGLMTSLMAPIQVGLAVEYLEAK